jgi:exodeoxyribonuclease VII large subunit
LLAAFSYRGVLARGFALVRDGDGNPLRSAASVAGHMKLDIEFSDGRVGATADGEGDAKSTPAKPKPKLRSDKPSGQGTLL